MRPWTVEVDEALDLIAAGKAAGEIESRTLDFKTDRPDPKAIGSLLAEAGVCFANSLGGIVVLGVDDKQRGPEAFVGTAYGVDAVRRLIHERTTPKLTVEATPVS